MPIWKSVLLIIALICAAVSVFLWIWNVMSAKKLRSQALLNPNGVKLPCKIEHFITIIGGIDNIISVEAISKEKLKVKVNDYDKINFDEVKKIENRGILTQNNGFTIIISKQAAPIMSEQITKILTKKIK